MKQYSKFRRSIAKVHIFCVEPVGIRETSLLRLQGSVISLAVNSKNHGIALPTFGYELSAFCVIIAPFKTCDYLSQKCREWDWQRDEVEQRSSQLAVR